MCWYQAEAWSVKYGFARCGRASATRSALPEASSVLTWSGVVTAPTVMVAMPTSFLTQSENGDRKSTRLNSSHLVISYAVFCLKKKKKKNYVQLYRAKILTVS